MLKQLLTLCLLIGATSALMAQVISPQYADKFIFQSRSGKTEIYYKTGTDTIPGFLFNDGSGKLIFKRGVQKINETTYVIGADTLRLAVNVDLTPYLLSSTAAATYADKASLNSYLLTADAASLYADKASLNSYLLTTDAATLYATKTSLNSYLLSSTAAGTYATLASLNGLAAQWRKDIHDSIVPGNIYVGDFDFAPASLTTNKLYMLGENFITANRTFTLPPAPDGTTIVIWNRNRNAFKWSLNGAIAYTPGEASFTTLEDTTVYYFKSITGTWLLTASTKTSNGNYLLSADAATLYATKTSLNSYLLTADAAATYADKASYLLSSTAASTYATQASLNSYLLTADAASLYADKASYLLSSTAAGTYATQASLNSYLLTADAASLYALKTSLNSYLLTADAASLYADKASLNSYLLSSTAASTYALKTDLNNLTSRVTTLEGSGSGSGSGGSIAAKAKGIMFGNATGTGIVNDSTNFRYDSTSSTLYNNNFASLNKSFFFDGNIFKIRKQSVTSGEAYGTIAIGENALIGNTALNPNNVAIGHNALATTPGNNNVALGNNALQFANNTSAGNSVAIGYQSLQNTTGGYSNTAVGAYTLQNVATGIHNTSIGYSAGNHLNGDYNTAVGSSALQSTTGGSYNTALGYMSLYTNTGGTQNVAIGYQALSGTIGSNSNIAIGYTALQKYFNSANNIAIGYNVMNSGSTNNNPNFNISIGNSAYANAGSNYNVSIGNFANADQTVQTGLNTGNVVIGEAAGKNFNGSYNVILGYNAAMNYNTTLNNALWIDNAANTVPLIKGSFVTTNRWLSIAGALKIAPPTTTTNAATLLTYSATDSTVKNVSAQYLGDAVSQYATAATNSDYTYLVRDNAGGGLRFANTAALGSTGNALFLGSYTKANRDAIGSPQPGNQIFQTEDNWYETYDSFWGWMPMSTNNEWKRNYGYEYFQDLGSATFTDGTIAATVSGTSAAVNAGTAVSASNRPGIAFATTGTTAAGVAGLTTDVTQFRYSVLGGGIIAFETAIQLPTLSTSTDRYSCKWGLSKENINNITLTTGVLFVYDEGGVMTGNTASNNFKTVTTNAGVRTITDTGIPVTAGSWYTLRIEINAAGTQATFKINGATVATHTTNLPTGANNNMAMETGIFKNIGLTARTMLLDFVSYKSKFITPR